jgi:hypothetical protein
MVSQANDRATNASRITTGRPNVQKVRTDPGFAQCHVDRSREHAVRGRGRGDCIARLGNGCAPWESAHHISRYFPSLQFPVFALSTFSSVSAFRNYLTKKRAVIRLLPQQQSNDATAFQFERFSFSFAQLQLRSPLPSWLCRACRSSHSLHSVFSLDSPTSQLLNASTNS